MHFLSIQAFLGNRYGYRPLPSQISLEHFDIFMEAAAANSLDTSLIRTWYKRDDNAHPSVYQLQPITQLFKHYHSKDALLRQGDRDGWWATFSLIQRLIWQLAEKARDGGHMSAELAHTFLMSGVHSDTSLYKGHAFTKSLTTTETLQVHPYSVF